MDKSVTTHLSLATRRLFRPNDFRAVVCHFVVEHLSTFWTICITALFCRKTRTTSCAGSRFLVLFRGSICDLSICNRCFAFPFRGRKGKSFNHKQRQIKCFLFLRFRLIDICNIPKPLHGVVELQIKVKRSAPISR